MIFIAAWSYLHATKFIYAQIGKYWSTYFLIVGMLDFIEDKCIQIWCFNIVYVFKGIRASTKHRLS